MAFLYHHICNSYKNQKQQLKENQKCKKRGVQTLHILHIVIDPITKEELKNGAQKMRMNTSKFFRHILDQSKDYTEKYLCTAEEECSKWMICDGTAHLYLYIKEKDYRKIKDLHSALNIYSMAQIVRAIIKKYLYLFHKRGYKKLRTFNKWFGTRWQATVIRAKGIFRKNTTGRHTPLYDITLSDSFRLLKVIILRL